MGHVFQAQDRGAADRSCAIKLLHPELAQSSDIAGRLYREAEAVRLVRHPNIVEVLDVGCCEYGPYLVMELLNGLCQALLLAT